MFLHGHYEHERREDVGEFTCPSCGPDATYALYRRYKYHHVYFIPVSRQVADECVRCERCGVRHPILVLASTAGEITSAFDSGQPATGEISAQLGNVVTLSEAAAEEIARRWHKGKFTADTAVRIAPADRDVSRLSVQFDYVMADGADRIGQSRGIPIVVDRRDAPLLVGLVVEFRDDYFYCSR